MQPERLKQLLEYNPLSGEVFRSKSKRLLTADAEGLVVIFDSFEKKSYRLKLDRIAYTLGYGTSPKETERVLHKNLDSTDNSLKNLALVSRAVFIKIKEAAKNLSGGIRMLPHATDQFSYVVSWFEKGIEKSRVLADIVSAKRLVLRLQLQNSKVLTRYCLFD